MDKHQLITIRQFQPNDENFIFKTFLEGFRHGNEIFKRVNVYEFNDNYRKVLKRLLLLPETQTKVACLKEDPDVILGFSITRPPEIIDWVYVKKGWRALGIAKDLLAHFTPTTVSHLTDVPGEILRKRYKLKFDPFK